MKLFTPQIVYHNTEPVYTCDVQSKATDFIRLATGGFDNVVRLWKLELDGDKVLDSNPVELVANLYKHERRVNVVRWNPAGDTLASASDDGMLILWTKKITDSPYKEKSIYESDFNEPSLESWSTRVLRRHIEDIYDLSWSANGNGIISGSIDCSAILWNLKNITKGVMLKDHKQFVQGVAWDPLDKYVVTQSNDRTFRVYRSQSRQCFYKVWRNGNNKLFFDGSWKYFFRRPEFSPDGRLLITPAGIHPYDRGQQKKSSWVDGMTNYQHAAHIFVRNNLSKVAITIPTGRLPVTGVRFNPVKYNLRQELPSLAVFKLPYRWIFCLIVETGVLIYDTEQIEPIAKISNIHCVSITDASWSPNGGCLVVSSTDGYCTYIYFAEGELGEFYRYEARPNPLQSVENLPESLKTGPGKAATATVVASRSEPVPDPVRILHDQSTELMPNSAIQEDDEDDDLDDDDEEDDEDDVEGMEVDEKTDDAIIVLSDSSISGTEIIVEAVAPVMNADKVTNKRGIDTRESAENIPPKKRRLNLTRVD